MPYHPDLGWEYRKVLILVGGKYLEDTPETRQLKWDLAAASRREVYEASVAEEQRILDESRRVAAELLAEELKAAAELAADEQRLVAPIQPGPFVDAPVVSRRIDLRDIPHTIPLVDDHHGGMPSIGHIHDPRAEQKQDAERAKRLADWRAARPPPHTHVVHRHHSHRR